MISIFVFFVYSHTVVYLIRFYYTTGFPGGSVVRNPPAKQQMRVRSLGQEDPLEKEVATHSSTPAWEIPQTELPSGLQSMKLQKIQMRLSD